MPGLKPMSNYKINIDKPLPHDQQIDQYKDFDALYREYQTLSRFQVWRELYRNPRYFGSLVAIVAVGFLVFQAVTEEQAASPLSSTEISLPLASVVNPLHTEFVSLQEEQVLSLSPTLELRVPEAAFVDEAGRVPAEQVELRYREFPSPAELFARGLSMAWEKDASLSPLTTLEVRAFADGRPLALAEGKTLHVVYLTSEGGEAFQVHGLNDSSMKWAFAGRDTIVALDTQADIPPRPQPPVLESLRDVSADTLVSKGMGTPQGLRAPLKPFRIKVDVSEFPELGPYENLNWVHIGPTKATDPWANGIIGQEWNDVKLTSLGNRHYEITFTKRDTESGQITVFKTVAAPGYPGMSYEEAMDVYEANVEAYEAKLRAMTEARPSPEAAMAAYQQALKEWEAAYGTLPTNEGLYRRSFSLPALGVYTLARPLAPAPSTVAHAVVLPGNVEGNPLTAWLVDPAQNTLRAVPIQQQQVLLPATGAISADAQLWIPLGRELGVVRAPFPQDIQPDIVSDIQLDGLKTLLNQASETLP